MSGGAAKVDKAAVGQQGDAVSVGELIAVDLGLDIRHLDARIVLEFFHLYLAVEMTYVADDSLVGHACHVVRSNDVYVAGSGHEDVADGSCLVHREDFVALHGGLQGADRVNLGDDDACAVGAHALGAALAHFAVAGHDAHLAGDHHVGGALDAIGQRFAAAVEVVEFRLGDRVVDVESGEQQLSLFHHAVEAMHACRSFFAHTAHAFGHLLPHAVVLGDCFLQEGFEFGFIAAARRRVEDGGIFLGLNAEVNHECGIATVVYDQVGPLSVLESHSLQRAPPVFGQAFAFPGKDRHTCFGQGSRCVVLGGVYIAGAPTYFGAEVHQCLDQHGCLYRSVQRAHDTGTFQGLRVAVLFTECHEAGHFVLCDFDFFAAESGQAEVCHLMGQG